MAARRAWPSATRRSVPFSSSSASFSSKTAWSNATSTRSAGAAGAAGAAAGGAAAGARRVLRPRALPRRERRRRVRLRRRVRRRREREPRLRRGGGGRSGRADGDRDRGRCHHDRSRLRDVDVTARERVPGPHAIGADDLEALLVLREPRRVSHVHHDQEQHGGDAEERQQLRHAEHPATGVLDGSGRGIDGRLRDSSGDRGDDEHAGTGEHDEEPAGCLHRADCRNHRAPRQPTGLERQASARSRTGSRPAK